LRTKSDHVLLMSTPGSCAAFLPAGGGRAERVEGRAVERGCGHTHTAVQGQSDPPARRWDGPCSPRGIQHSSHVGESTQAYPGPTCHHSTGWGWGGRTAGASHGCRGRVGIHASRSASMPCSRRTGKGHPGGLRMASCPGHSYSLILGDEKNCNIGGAGQAGAGGLPGPAAAGEGGNRFMLDACAVLASDRG